MTSNSLFISNLCCKKKWIALVVLLSLLITSYYLWDRINNSPQYLQHRKFSLLRQGVLDDMVRCSKNMGVSQDKLAKDKDKLYRIASKASTFLTALWEVIPEEFSKDQKTPCFLSDIDIPKDIETVILDSLGPSQNDLTSEQIGNFGDTLFKPKLKNSAKSLYCLPYFFLAGFPKCGTTSLDYIFRQHPQIAGPWIKEPQWWSLTPLGDMRRDYLKIVTVQYLLTFKYATMEINQHPDDNIITYDASMSFMRDTNFQERGHEIDYCAQVAVIHRVLPDAKIIVSMREPVSRLYSAYYFFHYDYKTWPKKMQENPSANFHVEVTRLVTMFQDCITEMSVFECTFFLRGDAWHHIKTNLGTGIYHDELQKWMQFYPRENFLFLESTELTNDQVRVMKKITDFLDIDPVSDEDVEEWFNNKIRAGFNYKTKENEMMPETRQLLEEFYAPFNKMLADLTNDTQFLWT